MNIQMSLHSERCHPPVWYRTGALLIVVGCISALVPHSARATTGEHRMLLAQTQTNAAADEEVRARVQAALHKDPYFYDQHVTVSVEKGDVILRGFVFSDWDLRNANRIAREAAGNRKVVNSLTIKEGGRH
jgi:osmotically-inducible protein OsmY